MPQRPVPADPGQEDSGPGAQPEPDPGWAPFAAHPDPRGEQDREAWLDHLAGLEEPFDPEEWWDPDGPPPPGEDRFTPGELAEIGLGAAEEMLTAQVVPAGRRGPGQPGSARLFPGESASPAAAFGAGMALDTAPGVEVTLDSISTWDCDHRFAANGHDPGVKLRHLSQVRHATCTSPVCRRPAGQCDFEHNTPYDAGGRTCLCNGGPRCKR